MIIKILQWNIWFKENPENIVKFLKESGADIICAQEIMRDSRKNLNVAKYISENLGFEYFYRDCSTWDNSPENFQTEKIPELLKVYSGEIKIDKI